MARLLFIFLLTLSVFGASHDVCACSCRYVPIKTYYENADAIFLGVVTEVTEVKSLGPYKYKIEVKEVFKGNVPKLIEIGSAGYFSSCSFMMTSKASYLIYASINPDQNFYISSCSGSHQVIDQDELKNEITSLKQLKKNFQPQSKN